MRLAPGLSQGYRRAISAIVIAFAIATATVLAQFGSFDPSFEGELFGVRYELSPAGTSPAGVAFANGRMFVVDAENATILAYNLDGTPVASVYDDADWNMAEDHDPLSPAAGLVPDQLASIDVEVDGALRKALFVSDAGSSRVVAFDAADGNYLFTFLMTRPDDETTTDDEATSYVAIGQMGMSPGGQFSLTTGATPQLSITGTFAAAWAEQWTSGDFRSGALAFVGPSTVITSAGFEFTAAPTNVLTGTEGNPLAPAPFYFFGLTFDGEGNLYALDALNERLHVYSPAMTRLFTFGTPAPGGGVNEFDEPWGMTFWPDVTGTGGRILINDTYNARILIYRPTDSNDADAVIDSLQYETVIENFVDPDPAIELYSIAIDPATATIAVTDFAQPRVVVLQRPRLAAFDVQLLDEDNQVVSSVCAGTPYKVRFGLTVPAGLPDVEGVSPTLSLDGVPSGVTPEETYPSSTLSAGQVMTFTYSLPGTTADVAVLASATATNTSDILSRGMTVSVGDCAADTDATTFTVEPNIPPQLSGWTPVPENTQYYVELTAQDDDGIETVEYQLEGAQDSAVISFDFEDHPTEAVVQIPISEYGRTTIRYHARDSHGIWSAWETFEVRPTLVSNRSTNENVAVEFRIGDPEGTGITYSVEGLPAGISFATNTGQFSGVVSFNANDPYADDAPVSTGVYNVVVTESDGTNQTSAGFVWTINHVNRPPVITNKPIEGAQITQGEAYSQQMTGSDPDGDPVIWTLHGHSTTPGHETFPLPEEITINPETGLISGVFPMDSDAGYTMVVGLAECAENTGTAPCNEAVLPGTHLATFFGFDIEVLDANLPPDIVNPGPRTNAEGETVSLQIEASDREEDPLTYAASGLPAGLSINSSTGVISGTIAFDAAQPGPYAVTVSVNDHVNTPIEQVTFNWTVTPTNRPPVVAIADRSNNEGNTLSGATLAGSATDPDGSTLTFSSSSLPPGITLAPDGALSGSFSFESAGVYSVTVRVSDGTDFTDDTFTWTVNNVNRAPTVTPVNQVNSEGDIVSYQLAFNDPDGDTLVFSQNGLPAELSLNESTGLITGSFGFDSATSNPYSVNVAVVDPSGLSSGPQPFTWTVLNTNRPPVIAPIANQANAEGQPVSVLVTASDPDGDLVITYGASNLPPGVSINPLTGVISGVLTFESAGNYTVTVTASDGNGPTGIGTRTFNWLVTNVNRPPVAFAPPRSNAEGDTVSYTITASDLDEDTLSYSATGLPNGISIDPATGTLTGTLANDTAGIHNVVITVSDGSATATAPFIWTITNVNAAPVVINPGDQVDPENTSVSLQIVATDADGDTLQYSATGLPPGLSINASTGRITGFLDYDSSGIYSVTVTVTDGAEPRSVSFTWTVTNVNRPPQVTNPGDQTSDEGAVISLQVVASDPDGDTLTYSATGLPPGLSINSSTGLVTGFLDYNSSGIYNVTVTVTDGSLPRSVSFTWTVRNENRPPQVTNPGDQTSDEGAVISLQVVASDPDGDTLTYSATGLPPGLSINSTTGQVTGTLSYTSSGIYNVTVTVTDGAAPRSVSFKWTVRNVNRPPQVTNPGNQTSNEGDVISRQIVATDPDNDALTYSAIGLPPGLSITSSGLIAGTLTTNSAGTHNVTVRATDPGGLFHEANFMWTVRDGNRPPTATDDTATVPQTQSVTIAVLANDSDLDGDTLTITAVSTPTSGTAVINSGNGTITFTATSPTFQGVSTFTYTVSDGTATATATVRVTITSNNQAPVAVDDAYETQQGQTLTVAAPGVLGNDSDANGDNLTAAIATQPSSGTVTLNANGSFTYTPASGFTGTATFTYTASDGRGGSDTATVRITVKAAGNYRTQSQGGWGASPSGNNAGAFLHSNYATVYPSGTVQVGGTRTLTFTSANAVSNFLPQEGQPGVLTASAVNPTTSAARNFAGQVLALRLSVDFSAKGVTRSGLGALRVKSGKLANQTVNQVLALANTVLGGNLGALPSGVSLSDLNTVLDKINNNFVDGTRNNGYLY
jgi:hypothetical protein